MSRVILVVAMTSFSGWLFQGYGPRQLTRCAGGTGGQVRPLSVGFWVW